MKTYSVNEAAKLLHCVPFTVREYIKNGTIKANKIKGSNRWVISEVELNKMLGVEGDVENKN